MRTFCEQNFTIVSAPIRSISSGSTFYPWDISFQSAGTGKCDTPTKHLSIHFEPLAACKLQTFPTVKSKTIGFLLNRTQQYTPVLVAKTPCGLLPEKELLSAIMWLIQR